MPISTSSEGTEQDLCVVGRTQDPLSALLWLPLEGSQTQDPWMEAQTHTTSVIIISQLLPEIETLSSV